LSTKNHRPGRRVANPARHYQEVTMALTPVQSRVDGYLQQPDHLRIRDETRNLTLKATIVSTSVSVDMAVKERPLELVYKAAIEKLNETLEPELGPNAIEDAAASGMDFSPEAVAERIVGFATGFFSNYLENHPDQESEEQLSGFMDLIRGAIDQGFEEARNILDGLRVLSGDISANVDKTYDLIQERLAAFENHIADLLNSSGGDEED
jgi:hypothetical protein